MSLRAAITGARGYLGSTLVRHFADAGHEAVGWHRGAGAGSRYGLGGDLRSLDWSGVEAVVHCAYDFRACGWEEIYRLNVVGSIELMRETIARGARFIFVSSMSCYEGCRSLYGKAKLEVENSVLQAGGAVIRPGLIYGNPPGGLFATLCRAVHALPVVPMIGRGDFPQYLVHHDDLARLIVEVAAGNIALPARPQSAANPQPFLFVDIVKQIAALHGRRPMILPVPWRAIYLAMVCAERVGLRLSFRSDSMLGLVFSNRSPSFDLPEGMFRPFPAGAMP